MSPTPRPEGGASTSQYHTRDMLSYNAPFSAPEQNMYHGQQHGAIRQPPHHSNAHNTFNAMTHHYSHSTAPNFPSNYTLSSQPRNDFSSGSSTTQQSNHYNPYSSSNSQAIPRSHSVIWPNGSIGMRGAYGEPLAVSAAPQQYHPGRTGTPANNRYTNVNTPQCR